MSVVVRRAAGDAEIEAAGELTAQAYQADRLIDPDDAYLDELADAHRRAREATLLVAVVPSPAHEGTASEAGMSKDVVVGTITMAPYGTSYAETAEPGELELRMLAVAPEMRGRGIAEALMRATAREAALLGYRRLVLSTMDSMAAAQRLYLRLGWTRVPERDWGHVEIHLRVFTWHAPAGPSPRVELATWPPVRSEVVDGFTLGFSGGLTRRANSALPAGSVAELGPTELDASITAVEAAYRLAGLAPCVRVDDVALGEVLVARGYREVTPTLVLVRGLQDGGEESAVEGGAAEDPGEPVSDRAPAIRVDREPDDGWLDEWLGDDPTRAPLRDTARTILLGSRSRYLSAVDGERVVGIVRVATARDDDGAVWAGIAGLAVRPEARGRGLGRALAVAALDEARALGADRAFVQVLPHNVESLRIFERLGFVVASAYRYAELVEDEPPR